MDIYTALSASAKLSEYISKFPNQRRNMYKSTADKLDKIKIHSDYISQRISTILQDVDCSYVNSNQSTYNISTLDDAVAAMFSIYKFMDLYADMNSTDSNRFRCIVDVCRNIYENYDDNLTDSNDALVQISNKLDLLCSQVSTSSENSSTHIDTSCKCSVFPEYINAFKVIENQTLEFSSIVPLRDILCRWISIRFQPNFRYKIENFREWIIAIIVSYSMYLQNNNISEFVSIFNTWLDTIHQKPDKYSLPYQVFSLYKHPNSNFDVTIAYIIYDILYEVGLKMVSKDGPLYLNDDLLHSWAENHNLQPHEKYDYYKSQPELLQKYNIN